MQKKNDFPWKDIKKNIYTYTSKHAEEEEPYKGLLNFRVLIRIRGKNHIISNSKFEFSCIKRREENGIGGFGEAGIGGIAETIGEEAKI